MAREKKKKKAFFGDSDSVKNNGICDILLDPIESHTHCCAIDFDETIRQVSAIKGELGDIATHTMVNTLNQLRYIQAIKNRSEVKKKDVSQPQDVSSPFVNISDAEDEDVSESEKPYSKRSTRVPDFGSEPLTVSSLRPHSEDDGDVQQDSVGVLKHSADADTSDDNYLLELPGRSKPSDGPEGRRHSRVLSLKLIPSDEAVDPLTHYLSKNASNFRKSLGERDLTEFENVGHEEQIIERVSNERVMTPEQRLSEEEFSSDSRLDEDDMLVGQKTDEVIDSEIMSKDEDNRSFSQRSEEAIAPKYAVEDEGKRPISQESGEDVAPKYVSDDEDDKLIIQKSEEDIAPKEVSEDEDIGSINQESDEDIALKEVPEDEYIESVNQESDEDVAPKSVSEDDFPEVLSFGEVEVNTIHASESDDIFTIEMCEDDFPDVVSVLTEDTNDDKSEKERVVPKKMSEESTQTPPLLPGKKESEEKTHTVEGKESLQSEVVLPPTGALPKEPVKKVESKGTITEEIKSTTSIADKKPSEKPTVRTLNTENMKNKTNFYMNISPKDTDSIIQFTIDSRLGNKKVKCDFSGNVCINFDVLDDSVAKRRSKKPKLKVLDLSNEDSTGNERRKQRKVSFDDQTGNEIWKEKRQVKVYLLLTNNCFIPLTHLLKLKEDSFRCNKADYSKYGTKNHTHDSNQFPSEDAKGMNFSITAACILNLINIIISITKFLSNAETNKTMENFLTNFTKFLDQRKIPNIVLKMSQLLDSKKHRTIGVEETVKFLTLFRFPEFYEKILENNNFQVMPMEQNRRTQKPKALKDISDSENEGNIQINLIGASSDTVTVAKKEESENGKSYNVFEIVIPHKPNVKHKLKETIPSDDESAEYKLYKKSYGEPRSLSATRETRQSGVSNKSERRSVVFADDSVISDLKNIPVKTAETRKDTAPPYQSGEPYGLQRSSVTQKDDVLSDDGEGNVSQISDSQADPRNDNYIYAADPRFASPFADQSGKPLPVAKPAVEIFEADVDMMPEFADIADAKYPTAEKQTSSPKKYDSKQPTSEIIKPEKDEVNADLQPVSEKLQPERYKKDEKSLPEREKFQSERENTDRKLQSPRSEVQPYEDMTREDRLVPSISDVNVSKRRMPIKGITSDESFPAPYAEDFQLDRETTESEENSPSISQESEHYRQVDARDIKPRSLPERSQSEKKPFDSGKPLEVHKHRETRALEHPEKADHKKFDAENVIVPESTETSQKGDIDGKDKYRSPSREEQTLKHVKEKDSPYDSRSPSSGTEKSTKPVEDNYNPLSPQRPTKSTGDRYSPHGSISSSRERHSITPVESKYSPHGSLPHSRKEQPIKYVEGKYSPLSPQRDKQLVEPVEGKFSPISPQHELPMKPVQSPHGSVSSSLVDHSTTPAESKYSPHGSLSPARGEQSMKYIEGKYSHLSPLGEERLIKAVEDKYSPISPQHEEQPMKPVASKSPHGSLSLSRGEQPMKSIEGKYSPISPQHEEQPMKPVASKSPHGSLSLSRGEQPMKSIEGKYSPISPQHEEQPMKPVASKYSPHGSLSLSRGEQPMKSIEGKYSPHGSLLSSRDEHAMKPVESKYSPISPQHEEQPMKHVTSKYSPHGSFPHSREEQPIKYAEGKYSPHGSLSSSRDEHAMKPVESKYSPISPQHEEQAMKHVTSKYSPHGSFLHSREEQPIKYAEGKYNPHGSLSSSRDEHAMKPVESKYSPISPQREEQPMKHVTSKYSPHGSLSPSRGEQPMKSIEGKYSPISPQHEEQPMKHVTSKYSPHGSLSSSRDEHAMKPVESKYSPISPQHEEQPMKHVTSKYSPHGSLSPSLGEQPMKSIEGKYSPISPQHEEQPMKHVTSKYSPHGSLSPSLGEQPMKSIEGKYSPISPQHEEQPMKHVTSKYSPHSSLSPSHEEQPTKPIEGKYSPRGSILSSFEKQSLKRVKSKESPRSSISSSREKLFVKNADGKHSLLPLSSEEQPVKQFESKYSPQGSTSTSLAEEPIKYVEGKYSPILPPSEEQPLEHVKSKYSPHSSISSPFHEREQPTSPSEKQPLSESSYKSEVKIPRSDQRPEDSGGSETKRIFETPVSYEDKYTANKYSSIKAQWPSDKRSVLSSEETESTETVSPDGSDTTKPKYSAGDPASVKSKTPEETDDTKLKPVHEEITNKRAFTPHSDSSKYNRNVQPDSLESEMEGTSVNKGDGKKDEYSPSERFPLSVRKHDTPVEEPPFVRTTKENSSIPKEVKFSDGTRPIRDVIESIFKSTDKPNEADTSDTTEGLKDELSKQRPLEQFMVYAGHVGESSPFLHKGSEFKDSSEGPDDDHRSSGSEDSSIRRFNDTHDVTGKDKSPVSDSTLPYRSDALVYAGEIEEQSPFSYNEYVRQREKNYSQQRDPSYSQQGDPSYSQQRGPGYSQQRDPSYSQQRGPGYSQQSSPGYSPQRGPSYSQQRDPSYSQQRGPDYSQQRGPSYSQQRDPSYSQQRDPGYSQQSGASYSQPNDINYSQSKDVSYSQQRGPGYSQQSDTDYSQQRDPTYLQQGDPRYSQEQDPSFSQQQDPSYSQQRAPGYGQQKDSSDSQKQLVNSQLNRTPSDGTQRVSFKPEVSKYEVTLPQKRIYSDDEIEIQGRAIIVLVKAKHFIPKEEDKRKIADSSQVGDKLDERKEGLESNKSNMETITEDYYDPDLIDDDETTFCTEGTQTSLRTKNLEKPYVSDKDKKRSLDDTIYRTGSIYSSEYASADETRRVESIASQQRKRVSSRSSRTPSKKSRKGKPTYSSDSSGSTRDRELKSLQVDNTTLSTQGTQTYLKYKDFETTDMLDKDKIHEMDDTKIRTGTSYQSEYGSPDVTRRRESIVSQKSRTNGSQILLESTEEPRKEKRLRYSTDSAESKRDKKIKSLTDEEQKNRWTTDEGKRKSEISRLPEFEVVANAALSKRPMKNEPIQPYFYKGELAYSMNVQSDRFNGTCNFYLDPKLRKFVRNLLIASAEKKK